MSARLLNITMNDGSRHFGDLPMTHSWHALRRHLQSLDGAAVTKFITDDITEAWIDFSYRGHEFSVNNQLGDWWFFVTDPDCPDEVLETVLNHCKLLLGDSRQ